MIGVLFLAVFVALPFMGCAPTYLQPTVDVDKFAAQSQSEGIMSADDYRRVMHLQAVAAAGKTLTDSDVDWLIALANEPGEQSQRVSRMKDVGMPFGYCRRSSLPADRISAVFNFAKELASISNTDGGAGLYACMIMHRVVGAPAIPDLRAMLVSPNDYVRYAARRALRAIANGT